MKLWLDDERPAPEGWLWVKTGQEAILGLQRLRQTGSLDELTHMSFDHDLADVHYDYWYIANHPGAAGLPENVRAEAREKAAKEMTGYDVLLWMAEHGVWPTEACYVHTHNSAAQDKMCGVINRYGPYETKVRWTPYQPSAEDIARLTE